MICRSCGAEIADKAIVCYRCGTPTADPVRTTPARKPETKANWLWVVVMIVIVGLGAWLIPKTTPGSPQRIAAWVVTWLVIFGAVTWLQRRRR